MATSSKKPMILGLAALAVAGGIAWVVIAFQKGGEKPAPGAADHRPAAATGNAGGSKHAPAQKPRVPTAGVPSGGGSDAVAKIVGDSSLSDSDAIAALQKIVKDNSRPIPERLEALDHTLNLIPNDKPELLTNMASEKVMPSEVRMRLMNDSLNRPQHLQGEILLNLLTNAAGDDRQAILHELAGLCGEDHGDDLAAWQAAVAKIPADK